MKFTRIPRNRDLHKKRVAAYCRVSTLQENQEDSFETQASYYTSYIKSNPDWEFAGIYSDEKSGTKALNRPGFQRLIRDALDGRVDYILVKSISRFSRNMVDCQNYIKMLHGNGVDVKFEKENMDTSDPSCSMMLSFLSAIAQDESRSISENVKWAYRERFKRGEYKIGSNRILGYDAEDSLLVPNKDAGVVRQIFRMYLEGNAITDITAELKKEMVVGRFGRPLTENGIRYILSNEVYTGDRVLQKRPPKNFLTKQPDQSEDYQSFLLQDDHEPLIDRRTWDAVQRKVQQEKKENRDGNVRYHGGRTHFLYGKVFCGCCASPFVRRTFRKSSRKDHKETYKVWVCREQKNGIAENGCCMRKIRETDLLAIIAEKMGYDPDTGFPVERFLQEVEKVLVGERGVQVVRR